MTVTVISIGIAWEVTLIKKVTNGKFEVKDFLGYDEEDGSFYYTSNEESPLRKAVYKIDKKGKKTQIVSTGRNQYASLQQIDEVLYEQVLQLGYSYVGYT